MKQTSIFAYHSLTDKQIGNRQKQVYNGLREIEPATNRMVSEHTGIPINVVTPRMGELVGLYQVEEAHRDVDPGTGRKAIFWQTKA